MNMRIAQILKYFSAAVLLLVLYHFLPGLWNYFITYPRLEGEIAALQQKYKQPLQISSLKQYRGLLHTHSYWSHDSRGVLGEIIPAAKKANIDFIFFSDHERAKLDTFPRAYSGFYNGILMVPGTENNDLLVWPLKESVIDWQTPNPQLIKQVIAAGGLVFYPHCEDKRDWHNPDYQAMEIYNIHTDIKDESYADIFFNTIINQGKYRHWVYRELFDEQSTILARWDSLNLKRRIVGFSAVDAHENQNIRARYLADGRVEWLGPNANPIDTTEAGLLEKLLLSEADENGWAFKMYLDTFYNSYYFVNNHVLADSLDQSNIAKHILQGHLFISFASLADAEGFLFYANDKSGRLAAILGDEIAVQNVGNLAAVSPFPGRFRLLRNGKIIDEKIDIYTYNSADVVQSGNYRLEVALRIDAKWVPWIYTNPIYIR